MSDYVVVCERVVFAADGQAISWQRLSPDGTWEDVEWPGRVLPFIQIRRDKYDA